MTPVSRKSRNVLVAGGLRIHICPKNASAAISHALHRTRFMCALPEEAGPEFRFMAVRHPLDRWVSVWAYFCRAGTDQELVGQHDLTALGYYWGMSFQEFLTICVQTHSRNPHTRMQALFAGPHHIEALCPIGRLQEAWEVLRSRFTFLNPLTVSHQSRHDPWREYYSAEQRQRLERLLAPDVDLYRQAQTHIGTFLNEES